MPVVVGCDDRTAVVVFVMDALHIIGRHRMVVVP